MNPATVQLPPPTPRWGVFDAAQYEPGPILERIRAGIRRQRNDGGAELVFTAMGTTCRLVSNGPDPLVAEFEEAAVRWVAAFEAKYSRFLPGSWISRANAAAGGAAVKSDPEIDRILALCHEMVFLTQGAFDPTALPLIQLWDWKRARVPGEAEVNAAKQRVGWRHVERRPGSVRLPVAGMSLDLGGMGKEYAVDQIALMAHQMGLGGALVDFGADIRVTGLPADGRPGWHVGLENPLKPGTAWCGLAVKNAGVASSGDYVRRFENDGRRFGHIIDVRTGWPVANGLRSVHVMAPSCTQAGMLSTAAFVLGPEAGLRLIESQPGTVGALLTESQKMVSRRFYEHVAS
jgi:FAD:protein FMN transferase